MVKRIIVSLLYCYIVILLIIILVLVFKYLNLQKFNNFSSSTMQTSTSQISASYFPASPAGGPLATSLSIPQITLDSIFSSDHSWISQLSSDQVVTIITTGDIIPARSVNYKMTQYNNFRYPFEKTADFLRQADITLINLESPLVKDCPVTQEGMIFCGNQQFIEGLKFAGVDVVNLANNHSLNYDIEGLNQTTDLLNSNGILVTGVLNNNLILKPSFAEASAGKQSNNLKVGFLGWNLLESFDDQEILEKIKESKAQVDLLIVSLHWGTEYTSFPAEWEKVLARAMIDNGADLIVGNHPHWIQPIEIYKNKLIIYAHGNFIFDQEWSRETKIGIVGKHIFYHKQLVDSQFFPVKISDYSQPQFLEDQNKQVVLSNLENISR